MSLPRSLFGETFDANWAENAACRGVDNDIFFSLDDEDQRQALALCGDCPVQTDCLQYALEEHEMYGIWGGMREADRRALIRERRRAQRQQQRRSAA